MNDGKWSNASRAIAIAAVIRNDEVFMSLLDGCLVAEDTKKAKRFLERIAAYHVALRTLQEISRKHNSKPLLADKIVIAIVRPKLMSFRPPTLDKLAAALLTEDQHKWFRVPSASRGLFTWTEVELKEHCEVQLVRFYIENANTVPVIPYLGVSKLSCFLCSLFLKKLDDPELPGLPIQFAVRGEHGKVYGRWLPPDYIVANGQIEQRVLQSLELVSAEVQTRARERLKLWVSRSVGGDSPSWSSEESSNCMAQFSVKEAKWIFEDFEDIP